MRELRYKLRCQYASIPRNIGTSATIFYTHLQSRVPRRLARSNEIGFGDSRPSAPRKQWATVRLAAEKYNIITISQRRFMNICFYIHNAIGIRDKIIRFGVSSIGTCGLRLAAKNVSLTCMSTKKLHFGLLFMILHIQINSYFLTIIENGVLKIMTAK